MNKRVYDTEQKMAQMRDGQVCVCVCVCWWLVAVCVMSRQEVIVLPRLSLPPPSACLPPAVRCHGV